MEEFKSHRIGCQPSVNSENIEAYTPKYGIDILLPYLDKSLTYWCPCDLEDSHFVGYLRELGYKIINSHISTGQDFFEYEPEEHWDVLMTNPPFKKKADFLIRAMSFDKPFAMLLPINGLGAGGIPKEFMAQNKELELLIPDKRMEFHNQPNNGISFKCVYYCWKILPKQIVFTKMNKIKLEK